MDTRDRFEPKCKANDTGDGEWVSPTGTTCLRASTPAAASTAASDVAADAPVGSCLNQYLGRSISNRTSCTTMHARSLYYYCYRPIGNLCNPLCNGALRLTAKQPGTCAVINSRGIREKKNSQRSGQQLQTGRKTNSRELNRPFSLKLLLRAVPASISLANMRASQCWPSL